jgi:hypothetical protein
VTAGGFPQEVADTLRRAGWIPGERDPVRARAWALALAAHAAPDGRHHAIVDPAVRAFAEYGGLAVRQDGAGEQIARSSFVLDPMRGVHAVAVIAELGELVGARMTPLGEEGDGTGVLAMDERGRVFLLDHTADWHLGDSLGEALTTLVLGRLPERVRDDGTWR